MAEVTTGGGTKKPNTSTPKTAPATQQPQVITEHGQGGGYTPSPQNPAGVGGDSPTAPTQPGAGGPTGTKTQPVDWADIFWGNLGLPPDIINGINSVLSGVTDDSQAQALGMNYLMGTDWFKTTFPGYTSGLTAGLFSDPSGYRQYVNDLNVLSQQYNGTPISAADVESYLSQGFSAQYVGNLFQGKAYVQANSPELQYGGGAFGNGPYSQADLTALGNEKAGIDTAYGQKMQNAVSVALQRMQKAFSGTLATPSLSLGAQGLNSPSAAGQKQSPDVAAI